MGMKKYQPEIFIEFAQETKGTGPKFVLPVCQMYRKTRLPVPVYKTIFWAKHELKHRSGPKIRFKKKQILSNPHSTRHRGLKYAVQLSIALLGSPAGAFMRVIYDPTMGSTSSGLVKAYVSSPNTDFARAYGCKSDSSHQITMPAVLHACSPEVQT
jgi:hypothetical protein